MAEYGYRSDDNGPARHTLLTGGLVLGGLFAFAALRRPGVAAAMQREALAWASTRQAARGTLETLAKQTPEISLGQSLGYSIARSRFMDYWKRAVPLGKPFQLADELFFLRSIRETYSVSQVRKIGPLGKLELFRGLIPKSQAKNNVFFAYGKLYQDTASGLERIAGNYRLYGRSPLGAHPEVFQRSIRDLRGLSIDLDDLQVRDAYLRKRIDRLTTMVDAGEKLTREQQESLRHLGFEHTKLRRTLERVKAPKKFAEALDIGFNETSPSNFSEWREQWGQRLLGIINPADMPARAGLDPKAPFGVYHAFTPNVQGFKDMFFGGANGRINLGTILLYHLFNRINTEVASQPLLGWLAMSAKSTQFKLGGVAFDGPAAFIANTMLKRMLPIYATLFYSQYVNDQLGQWTGTRPTDAAHLQVAHADRVWAGFKDRHGISAFARHVNELSGGALGYIAHPFVDLPVGLSREELTEFQEHGQVPVRKGRWWWFGSSTPFRGERVQYFNPTSYQYAKAGDVYKTDTLWGSPDEYYANAALPTPFHPLAPLRHLIFDRYHWENKHYADRPYPESAPAFEPTTPYGAILNPTLGRLIKPTRHYHEKDLPYQLWGPHRGQRNPDYKATLASLNEQIKALAAAQQGTGFVTPGGSIEPMGAVAVPGSDREISDINDDTYDAANEREDGYAQGIALESYGEGARSIAPYGSGKIKGRRAIKELNASLRSMAKRFTAGRILEPTTAPGALSYDDPNDPRVRRALLDSASLRYGVGLGYYSLTELGGIYGFSAVTATGDLYANRPTIANAGQMTGFERTYWDLWNVGGLAPTPGLSEGFRRFLPHRFHSNRMINPIRNTMPTWLPGSQGEDPAYFLDFLHGDPYCLEGSALVEVNGTELKCADKVQAGDLIRTHTGAIRPVEAVAVRPVAADEDVFRITPALLPAFPFAVSEEHPILVANYNRKNYGPDTRQRRYELANAVLAILSRCSQVPRKGTIAHEIGIRPPQLSAILALLEKDGKIERPTRKAPLKLIDPQPYDIDLLTRGLRWVQAKDLRKRRIYAAYPLPAQDGEDVTLDLSDYLDKNEFHIEGNQLIYGGNSHRRYAFPRHIVIDEAFAAFCGYWVAEGFASLSGHISWAFHEKEAEYRAEIDAVLQNLIGRTGKTSQGKGKGVNHAVNVKPLALLLRALFGHGSHNKHVPSWWINLRPPIIAAFLRGLFNGDGCCFHTNNRSRIALTTVSRALAYQTWQLLLKLRIVGSVIYRLAPSDTAIKSGPSFGVHVNGDQAQQLADWLGYELPIYKGRGCKQWFIDDAYLYLRIANVETLDRGVVTQVYGFQVGTDNSFCVAGIATHNTSIPNGEVRLPGASYERLHGIASADLTVQSSQVGYGDSMLYGFVTGDHAPFAAWNQRIAESSSAASAAVLRDIHGDKKVFYEVPGQVQGVVDAVVGQEAVEVHTLSSQGLGALKGVDPRHAAQLQIDMGVLGLRSGTAIYVDRDDPSVQKRFTVSYDKGEYTNLMQRIERVQRRVNKEIREGQWAPGAFYSDLTKLQILGDVAPWSQQYKRYRDYLVHLDESQLTPAERQAIIAVKHQVTERKHRYTMSPYMTKYSDLTYRNVHVKDVIDPNTFTTQEYPDTPVRLAGVHIGIEAADWIGGYIHPGASLRVGLAADETQRVSHDTLHTMRATVFAGDTLLNRAAIDEGYGTEKDENTPAGIHTKYSTRELKFAHLLESIAHAPIPYIHNKLLPIDSPLDLYKRTQVYGKDWQDWRHPFADYIAPSFESFAHQGLLGIGSAFFLGWTLGAGRKGRVMLGSASAAIAAGLALFRRDDGIPQYRQKERDVDEYFDILRYIKYEGLYAKTRSYIQAHEHHDIGSIIDRYKREGEQRKRRIQVLKTEKRQLLVSGDGKRYHQRLKAINDELRVLQSYRRQLNLSRADLLAIQYKRMAQTTLYGAEPGGDLRNVLLALPPTQREFFQHFLHAAGPERKEILNLVPRNERRFLEAAWGLQAEDRPHLQSYFQEHYLPAKDWNGWRADYDLDDYKLVVMKQEGMDMTAHGFWPQDEERVREKQLKDLRPQRATPGNVHAQLHAALAGMGLRDVDIQLIPNNTGKHHVDLQIDHSRQDEMRTGTYGY